MRAAQTICTPERPCHSRRGSRVHLSFNYRFINFFIFRRCKIPTSGCLSSSLSSNAVVSGSWSAFGPTQPPPVFWLFTMLCFCARLCFVGSKCHNFSRPFHNANKKKKNVLCPFNFKTAQKLNKQGFFKWKNCSYFAENQKSKSQIKLAAGKRRDSQNEEHPGSKDVGRRLRFCSWRPLSPEVPFAVL